MKNLIHGKRGQERESSLGWIIGIAFVVIVLAILGGGYYYYTNVRNTVTPGDVTIFTQKCSTAAQLASGTEYCSEFRAVGISGLGTKTINCQYPTVQNEVAKTNTPPQCAGNEAITFCLNSKQNSEFKKDVSVWDPSTNSFFDCKALIAAGGVACAGAWTDAACPAAADDTLLVTNKSDFMGNLGKKCCRS